MARAPKRRGDALIEHPAHREVDDALAIALLRQLIETLHCGEILRKARRLEFGIVAPEVIALELGFGAHAAGQQAAAERAIAERGDAILAAIRKDVLVDGALEEIVRRLHHVQRRDGAELVHLRDREIADADGADFALLQSDSIASAVSSIGVSGSGQCTW